ncbi:MAG: DUF2510 domain-containing protein [Acidobacteriota bacterium]|nr:DUF2510 domain-containing protein [Acidobacteriota bacterium]
MGFLRKAFIVGTGGLGRVAVNPNSKKARIMRASERQFALEVELANREAAYQQRVLGLLRTPTQPARAAGWYADPSGRHMKRWWDGARWTERVIDADGERRDPM